MYKLISTADVFQKDSFIDTVIKNRGIENKERFLNPSADDLIHYSKLVNIDKAVEVFKKHIQKENPKIAIIVDSDPDGFCSSAILGNYIEKYFHYAENLYYLFHKGKQHGITNDKLSEIKKIHKEYGIDLLIIPDAGTNDIEHHKIIKEELGIDIIIVDHHIAEGEESPHAIIVNNQISPEYHNKQL